MNYLDLSRMQYLIPILRILVDLVSKMREMNMDQTELGCLRAIILFNPDEEGLQDSNRARVEELRGSVYTTLDEYTRYNKGKPLKNLTTV